MKDSKIKYLQIIIKTTKTSNGYQCRCYLDGVIDGKSLCIKGRITKGFGYDKASTALSYVLNENEFFKNLAIEFGKSDKRFSCVATNTSINNKYPAWFAGGCGLASYRSFFNELGFNWIDNNQLKDIIFIHINKKEENIE